MRGREISSAYDFLQYLASGVLLVPTALALIGRSSGESSGGSANAESLSVLLGSGNATKILKGLFFPQLRLSGFLFTVWSGIRNVDADGALLRPCSGEDGVTA